MPFWLEDITDHLIPTEVHARAHISQDSDSEHSTKVATKSRKHRIYTHCPKDRNCEVCLRTEMTKAPCRKRIGQAVPRAEKFGDLITHQYAVVVQDLATQRIESYPCKTKTSYATEQRSRKFLELSQKRTSIMESSYFDTPSIRDKWHR